MSTKGQRQDPVESQFARLERLERGVDALSWLAIASFAVYVALHLVHSQRDSWAKLIFILLTVLAVVVSYVFRFVMQPPADRRRRRLLIRDGTGAAVTTEVQDLYWNNSEGHSVRRLLFNLAENTFFLPRLLGAELRTQIVLVGIFVVALVVSIRVGTAEVVELFAVLLVFSEVLLGKLVRMVWTLLRVRHLHLDIVGALRDRNANLTDTYGRALFLLGEYEYIKARAGYRASDRTFAALNPRLTAEWEAYRDTMLR